MGWFFLKIEINTGKQTKYQRKSYLLCSEKLEYNAYIEAYFHK